MQQHQSSRKSTYPSNLVLFTLVAIVAVAVASAKSAPSSNNNNNKRSVNFTPSWGKRSLINLEGMLRSPVPPSIEDGEDDSGNVSEAKVIPWNSLRHVEDAGRFCSAKQAAVEGIMQRLKIEMDSLDDCWRFSLAHNRR